MPHIPDEDWAKIQAEYQRLQARAQIADFIEPIYNDPLLSDRAKALIKEKYPQVSIPDWELKNQFNQQIDQVRKEREDEKKEAARAEQQAKWDASKNKVQKDYGFTEDGMKDLEKFMVENNIGSYEIAAEYRAQKTPKTLDATYNDGFWHHTKQDSFKEIAADPEGWAHKEIFGALVRDQERAKGR